MLLYHDCPLSLILFMILWTEFLGEGRLLIGRSQNLISAFLRWCGSVGFSRWWPPPRTAAVHSQVWSCSSTLGLVILLPKVSHNGTLLGVRWCLQELKTLTAMETNSPWEENPVVVKMIKSTRFSGAWYNWSVFFSQGQSWQGDRDVQQSN